MHGALILGNLLTENEDKNLLKAVAKILLSGSQKTAVFSVGGIPCATGMPICRVEKENRIDKKNSTLLFAWLSPLLCLPSEATTQTLNLHHHYINKHEISSKLLTHVCSLIH